MNIEGAELVQITPKAAPTSSFKLVGTLVIVAAVSGLLIAGVVQRTAPIIKRNRAEALRQAVFEVIPKTKEVVAYRLAADGRLQRLAEGEEQAAVRFFAGYDAKGRLRGVAAEGSGQGFQDKIELIYGYSPQKKIIIGVKVLGSKETPGLGDKIETDAAFQQNFKRLDVRLTAAGDGLRRRIEVVKPGEKSERWQIAAITGATISSKAVGAILDRSANEKVPHIVRNLEQLQGAEDAE